MPTIYFGNILGGEPVMTYESPDYISEWCHEMGFKGNTVDLGGYTDTGLTWRNNRWDDERHIYGKKITALRCTVGK